MHRWSWTWCRGLCSCSRVSHARVCVVGSGPAGFYTAQRIIKRIPQARVDILEKLPVPFGLVRFGVAPDHPEVKNVVNQFTSVAQSGQCRFYGNVQVGRDITVAQLKRYYHAVVLAYGAEHEKTLAIPGEGLPGIYSARAFVGWYNGLPEYANLNPDLSGETAVIIGHGNVALDVARILLSPVKALESTDICEHALEALRQSRVRRVELVGRRGPLQAAFTIKELREMTRLPGCRPLLDPSDFAPLKAHLLEELPRPRRRLTELMIKTAEEKRLAVAGERTWRLAFLRSPVEFLSCSGNNMKDSRVTAVRLETNKLEGSILSPVLVKTGHFEERQCSLAVCSIGYRSESIDTSVPFDSGRGVVTNNMGRVVDANGNTIFGRLQDNLEDKDISELFSAQGVAPTTFSDWVRVDREEQLLGKRRGKPREKIVSLQKIFHIIHNP